MEEYKINNKLVNDKKIVITIYKNENGELPDIRDEWNKCLQSCPSDQHLFTFEWYEAWLKTYGSHSPWTGESLILLANIGAKVVAIFPLAVLKKYGLIVLSLGGYYQPMRSFVSIPGVSDIVIVEFLKTLLDRRNKWHILRFNNFGGYPNINSHFLKNIDIEKNNFVAFERGISNIHRFPDSLKHAKLSGSVKRIERYKRAFLKYDNNDIRHFNNPTGPTVDTMLNDFQTIEKNSWLTDGKGNLRFKTDIDLEFWKTLIKTSLSPCKQFNAWIAYLKNKPIAFRILFTTESIGYAIANQYDKNFTKLRLGWILILESHNYAHENKIELIDSEPGDAHYKVRLGGESGAARQDILLFPNNIKGYLLSLIFKTGKHFFQ